ncbi:MAG: serine/threonine-protein kinase, partial [Myxococcota bacterium]
MGGDESLPRGVGVGAGSVTLSDDRAGESPGPRRDDLAAAFKAVDGDSDELAREHARARLSEQLFGVALEPVKRGRFVIIEQLGQGGMGVVYSAYDPQLDRRVALKVLRADAGTRNDGDRARDRLLREAQALARLSHPHVVPIHDVGVISSDDEVDSGRHGGDQVYLVMEFVVGRTLRDWASDDERSWREVLAVYEQAGRGLAAAHAAGLVHRDFKPDNALIGEDGRVRVLDFGLARGRHELEDSSDDRDAESAAAATRDALSLESTMDMNALSDGESDTGRAVGPDTLMPPAEAGGGRLGERMTATGAILGTPAYMAPEQLLGHKVGPAGDQYSFCVAIYEALYGQRPHAGATLAAITAHRVSGRLREPPPRSAVPGWIFSVLRRGLARQPDERYPSMDELLSALGRDPARVRRRWLIGLAAAVVVAGSLTVAGLAVTRARSAVAPCTGGAEMMAELWGDSRREELGRV